MPETQRSKRFTVSDVGFGFAVHDTWAPYQRLTGEERGKLPDTTNELTSRIVEVFPTREAAWRHARRLNASA